VNALGQEAVRLQGIHGDQGDQINAKKVEMERDWTALRDKVCIQTSTFSNYISHIPIVDRNQIKSKSNLFTE
jgi:hypothetical protein